MRCPRDKMLLDENVELDGVMVDICSYCDGVWLDSEALSTIIDMKKDILDGARITAKLQWDELLPCPACGVEMQKRYFSKLKKVKIDKCFECLGIWLDTGEMREVIEVARTIKEKGLA